MTQPEHDQRWDELALGHVLGGLADADASVFRGHLAGCGQCRARVAELRSMASEMAAAEREERATRRLRTQIESRREAPPDDTDADAGGWVAGLRRRALVAGTIVVLAVLGLGLWNASLRAQNAELRDVAGSHARTLTTLGSGTVVPVTASQEGVTGVVSVDGDLVAYSLANLPVPAADERLVVWLEVGGEHVQRAVHTPRQIELEDGRLAATLDATGASRLLVTRESVVVPGQPVGPEVVRADLNVARPEADA
jgi:anti-sigma factor RsiW